MKPLNGKYFVQGVKAFELKTPIKDFPPDKDRSRARRRALVLKIEPMV